MGPFTTFGDWPAMVSDSHLPMTNFLRTCDFLLMAGLMASCYDCGPKAEPLVDFDINTGMFTLKKVGALGAVSDSLFQSFTIHKNIGYGKLPLSLLHDSTTYLFYFEDRVDTLTLYYQRIFDTRKQCGYYVDIAPPVWEQYRSTFSSVRINYSPYVGEILGFTPTAFGISVYVSRTQ
jgi:hypothetical protein